MPISMPEGFRLLLFEEIDSTNEEARRRAGQGDPGKLWILALRQMAGRGRHGRQWHSGEGDLTATLLLRPDCSPAEGAKLSFAACLAMRQALASFVPTLPVTLKWPNDVLLNRRKVAGILLESAMQHDGCLDWLCIGFGANLVHRPQDTAFSAASLAEEGLAPPPLALVMKMLAVHMDEWLMIWEKGSFSSIRQAWLANAEALGKEVRVRLPREEARGTFETIDESGSLVLRGRDGELRTLNVGDMFFS